MQLDGENSPATFTKLYDVTEAGEYVAVVGLSRSIDGKTEEIVVRSNVSIVN